MWIREIPLHPPLKKGERGGFEMTTYPHNVKFG